MRRTDQQLFNWSANMTNLPTRIAIALVTVVVLSSCANTIRGAGEDAKETTHAVKHAVQ
jgi:predicted small secreted protein